MAEQEFRARIHPDVKNKRITVGNRLYMKERGWYSVSRAKADELLTIGENPLNPMAGRAVFQVVTKERAAQIVRAETFVAKPVGTVENPADPDAVGGYRDPAKFIPRGAEIEGLALEDEKPAPAEEPETEDEDDDEGLLEAEAAADLEVEAEAPVREKIRAGGRRKKKIAKSEG